MLFDTKGHCFERDIIILGKCNKAEAPASDVSDLVVKPHAG